MLFCIFSAAAAAGAAAAAAAGYTYDPSTGQLLVSATNRISVKGWNSGMTANTATNKILTK
jgi:hypothetical protein